MKHKDFLKLKEIELHIYPYTMIFGIVRKEIASKYMDSAALTIAKEKDKRIFIYLRQGNHDKGLLAHEIFHACELIMEGIGQKYNYSDTCCNETWAYLIQFITNEWDRVMK